MTNSWSGDQEFPVAATLDVRPLFNPIDCRSLGVIKVALREIPCGAILEVSANRFQQREIEAWVKKFSHRIVRETDGEGLVKIYIEKLEE